MLFLSRDEVRRLLDLDALIEALGPAMADLSAGRASTPPRIGAWVEERGGVLAAMPGHVPSLGALTAKLVTLFPRNEGTPVPTHQALIVAFDPGDGSPVAAMDGTEITAVRTGACSALSARLLAREDASVLAILGTGVQALTHARAMARVRPLRELRVGSRDPARAAALAASLGDELGIPTRGAASYDEAAAGADIVCAVTHSREPVVRRDALSPGTHVTSVGFNREGREVDDATLAEAYVCVESREVVLAPLPAGSLDLIEPVGAGVVAEEDLAELGEVVLGSRPGRSGGDQLTLYKSVGVAVQDAAAASLVLAAARAEGAGRELAL